MFVTIVCQLPCTAGYYLELLQNATLLVDILARLTSWQNLEKKPTAFHTTEMMLLSQLQAPRDKSVPAKPICHGPVVDLPHTQTLLTSSVFSLILLIKSCSQSNHAKEKKKQAVMCQHSRPDCPRMCAESRLYGIVSSNKNLRKMKEKSGKNWQTYMCNPMKL